MRPLNKKELDMGGHVAVSSKGNTISVKVKHIEFIVNFKDD